MHGLKWQAIIPDTCKSVTEGLDLQFLLGKAQEGLSEKVLTVVTAVGTSSSPHQPCDSTAAVHT